MLVIVLAGCNQLYGLDETIGPPPLDSDKDTIPDEDDNCVLVPNLDQANLDDDVFGDACDPCPAGEQSGIDEDHDGVDDTCDACPRGPNHDEDSDGVLDGCDTCPGLVNADQIDGDGDDVGDACDSTVASDQRVFFDAFAPPDPQWNTGFAVWMATGDGYAPVEPPTDNGLGPWNRNGVVSGGSWQIATLVKFPDAPPNNMRIGVTAVEESNSMPAPACELYFDEIDQAWHDAETGTALAVKSPLYVALRVEASGQVSLALTCTYDDHVAKSSQNYFQATYFPELLLRGGSAEFAYIDVVQ